MTQLFFRVFRALTLPQRTTSCRQRFAVGLTVLFAVISLCTASPLAAQDMAAQAADKDVEPHDLKLFVVPLTVDELSELATVWQGHVAEGMETFVRLNAALRDAPEAEKSALRNEAVDVANDNTRMGENYSLVIDAWSNKGGVAEDVTIHRQYLTAVLAATVQSGDLQTLFTMAMHWLVDRDGGLGLLLQIVVFVLATLVLLFVARFVRRVVERALLRVPTISRLLRNFVLMVVYWATVVLGLMVALGIAGVNVTPLFAVFGGLSFIIGFALQDTLGNLASGLMIMILKPFDTGDFIEISGASGEVDSMSVVSTQIRTFDNQVIVVPNSKIWGDVITNVSAAPTRRVDMVFGIAYSDTPADAIKVLEEIIAADKRCLKDPAPAIFVGELGDSSVNIFCRPWCATDDYWDVYWDVTGLVKERFDAEGISIPFPQRDVHLITEAPAQDGQS